MADAIDLDASYLNQLLTGHRGIGERTARKLEKKLHLPELYLDRDFYSFESPQPPDAISEPPVARYPSGLTAKEKRLLELFRRLTDPQQEQHEALIEEQVAKNEQFKAELEQMSRRPPR